MTTTPIYRFQYQKYSHGQKHICPSCNQKTFVRYADIITGQLLPEKYGKCDRLTCGYKTNPYQDGYYKSIGADCHVEDALRRYVPEPEPIKIPSDIIIPGLAVSERCNNSLYQYLITLYDPKQVDKVFTNYHVGTSRHFKGGVSFPLFDGESYYGGKVIAYDVNSPTCKTRKWAKDQRDGKCINWIHAAYAKRIVSLPADFQEDAFFATLSQNLDNSALHQWLFDYEINAEKYPFPFGVHLALEAELDRPLYIVESEKSAIVGALELPDVTWLATGGATYLTENRLRKLKNRKLLLIPDGGHGYTEWVKRAKELSNKGFNIKIAPFASHLQENQDIADVFLLERWTSKFKNEQILIPSQITMNIESEPETVADETREAHIIHEIKDQTKAINLLEKHPDKIASALDGFGLDPSSIVFQEIEAIDPRTIKPQPNRYNLLTPKQAYRTDTGEIQLFY